MSTCCDGERRAKSGLRFYVRSIFMRQSLTKGSTGFSWINLTRVQLTAVSLILRGEPCKNEMLLSQMGVHFKR